jgi:hypothetical protein
MHPRDIEMLLADGADTILPLVRFASHVVSESPYIQVPFLLIENVGVDALLVRDIFINHQTHDFLFERSGIEVGSFVEVA